MKGLSMSIRSIGLLSASLTAGLPVMFTPVALAANNRANEPLRIDLAAAASAPEADGPILQGLTLGDSLPPVEQVSFGALANTPTSLLPAIPGLAPEAGAGGEDKWWLQPTLSIWLPGISGDIGVRRLTANVNADFIDVLDDSDSIIGLTGAFEFGKGKIGGYVAGSYMKVGAEAGPNNRIDITNEIALFSFGVSYEIWRHEMEHTAKPDQPARDLTLTLTAGGRYTDVSVDVDFDVLPDRSGGDSWVDPMIGAKVVVPFSQHWSFVGGGEIGGFGVASDFAWSAAAVISWDFYIKEFPSALQFGYLAVGDDYSKGSGRSRFEWDTVLHGLLLNFTVRF